MITVDASVAVKWALPETGREEARAVLRLRHKLVAPDLIFPEAANVFRKRMKLGEMTLAQAENALGLLAASITTFSSSRNLALRALHFAQQLNHPAYDCFYLAVAEADGYLVTADEVLVRKCAGSGVLDGRIFSLSELVSIPLGRDLGH